MSWQTYPLAFRLLSPLHVGYRKVGNLQQTRGYVTGKMLWAGLTARLTRDAIPGATGADYERIGAKVNAYFRFSYLYPALDPAGPACWPWQDETTFAYRFLDSYASTALDYTRQSAAEGMLHEVEYIRPWARPLANEEPPQVYLLGWLYVQAELDAELAGWKITLTRLQVGGERGYGWGRLKLLSDLSTPRETGLSAPLIHVGKHEPITAHALAVAANGRQAVANLQGAVEPLVGWERDNRTARAADKPWRVSEALICYAPGSVVTTDARFIIGHNGIWEAAEP